MGVQNNRPLGRVNTGSRLLSKKHSFFGKILVDKTATRRIVLYMRNEKEIIERGSDLSGMIAHRNARIGIGRRWARFGLKLFIYRRRASRFAARIGGAS
jgi:hypothetical protein